MKKGLFIFTLITGAILLIGSTDSFADPGKGNNKKTTGIAVDNKPGNPNSNENAQNNTHANPRGANENGIIHSNPNALPLQQPVGVPIDGGAGALLLAGAAYGVKRIRAYRKNKRKVTTI